MAFPISHYYSPQLTLLQCLSELTQVAFQYHESLHPHGYISFGIYVQFDFPSYDNTCIWGHWDLEVRQELPKRRIR